MSHATLQALMAEKQTSVAMERKLKQEGVARVEAEAKALELESVVSALEDKLATLQRDTDMR
jgi:hypothetical protein